MSGKGSWHIFWCVLSGSLGFRITCVHVRIKFSTIKSMVITYPGPLEPSAAAGVDSGPFTKDNDCLLDDEPFKTDFIRSTYLLNLFFFSSGATGPVVAGVLMVVDKVKAPGDVIVNSLTRVRCNLVLLIHVQADESILKQDSELLVCLLWFLVLRLPSN